MRTGLYSLNSQITLIENFLVFGILEFLTLTFLRHLYNFLYSTGMSFAHHSWKANFKFYTRHQTYFASSHHLSIRLMYVTRIYIASWCIITMITISHVLLSKTVKSIEGSNRYFTDALITIFETDANCKITIRYFMKNITNVAF